MTCGQKPQEQECAEGFFHCTVSKACVPNDQLCDLSDDCGDNSDEEAMECELTKPDTFEDDSTPFGLFTHNSEYHDFEWERGSGMTEGQYITGPPFDHTTFGQNGHYLFIRVCFLAL